MVSGHRQRRKKGITLHQLQFERASQSQETGGAHTAVSSIEHAVKARNEAIGEFHSVQYLRGIAAVAVVYFHTKIYMSEFAWPIGRQFGYGGVDLFFAISGFIMMVTTSVKPETPWAFYLKRIIRVVPLYWAATLMAAALFLLIPSAFVKQTM